MFKPVPNLFKLIMCGRQAVQRSRGVLITNRVNRTFADDPKANDFTTKQLTVQGNEKEEPRLRVRRARPTDVPQVLRFVKEHARVAWPGLVPSRPRFHLVLCDYVARALAQGHSMLAEQQEDKRGWGQICGLAVGTALCPWDAAMLEQFASCVKCMHARRFLFFTAHCLRAPALHDKYSVRNILQIMLIVPVGTPRSKEIIQMLAKNVIQRGQDVGFPLLRFDVTNETVLQTLEAFGLNKEWNQSYEINTKNTNKLENIKKAHWQESQNHVAIKPIIENSKDNFIAVYTALTCAPKKHENLN